MASRGSVIPLFIQQVKDGQPLTITDPNMTRFMMSIDDAVDLVLFAYQHGKPGDIFVQKAPAATIETLALAIKAAVWRAESDSCDRHPARREAVRDAAHARGTGQGRGHGELFPRSRGQPRPQLQRVFRAKVSKRCLA